MALKTLYGPTGVPLRCTADMYRYSADPLGPKGWGQCCKPAKKINPQNQKPLCGLHSRWLKTPDQQAQHDTGVAKRKAFYDRCKQHGLGGMAPITGAEFTRCSVNNYDLEQLLDKVDQLVLIAGDEIEDKAQAAIRERLAQTLADLTER